MKHLIHCLLALLALTGWSATTRAATGNPGTFVFTGSLNVGRTEHAATLLPDGRVLIVGGGLDTGFGTASVEIYDPGTGAFTLVGNMLEVRGAINSAAVLTNGRVLISGSGQSLGLGTTRCELFVPSTGQFIDTGDTTQPFAAQNFTVMKDGRVLMVEGRDNEKAAEIYNPALGIWTTAPDTINRHLYHDAVLLLDGRVLLNSSLWAGIGAEVFNPATGSFEIIGQFLSRRTYGSFVVMTNGLVFTAGGSPDMPSAELFDPATGTSTNLGFLNIGRQGHTTTLLTNGTVLLAGGASATPAILRSAEVFEPATRTFRGTGSLRTHRTRHTATRLLDGRVLIVGGQGENGTVLASAEIYNPAGVNSLPFISAFETSALEGDTTTNSLAFQVRLSKSHTATVAVNYATYELTAHPGSDYLVVTGRVTFPPGVTNRTVLVPIRPDKLYEPDETLLLTLDPNSATNGIVERGQALGTILNDEAFPTVLVANASVVEGRRGLTNLVFNVMLSTPSQTDIFASCVTADGTARAGEDYIPKTNQLYFPAGVTNYQQVVVPVKGDYTIETNETVWLQLFSVTNAMPGPPGVGTIVNDDGLPGVLHHYGIAPISSPQFWNYPTTVTVEALDAFNQRVNLGGPLDLFVLATNPPTLTTTFDNGTLDGWTPLNLGTSPGPYEIVPFDVAGDSHESPAFRIGVDHSAFDGLERAVALVAGTSYLISMDLAVVNGTNFYRDSYVGFWLTINGQQQPGVPFNGYVPPGHVNRAHATFNFNPPTNGVYRLGLTFNYAFVDNFAFAGYLDNFEIRPQPTDVTRIELQAGVRTVPLVWRMPMTNLVLMVRDSEGYTGVSNPFDALPSADVAVNSQAGGTPRVGRAFLWNVEARNTGPNLATGVTLTNILPPGITSLSISNSGGSCTNENGVVRCQFDSISSGDRRTVYFSGIFMHEGRATNVAQAGGHELDIFPDNNTSRLGFDVAPVEVLIGGSPSATPIFYATENPAGTNVSFPVILLAPRTNTVTVDFFTAPGAGASPGVDYLPTNGTLVFLPGVTQQVVNVPVLDDALDEDNESVRLHLTNAVGAWINPQAGEGVILDNGDLPPSVSISDATVVEGDVLTNMVFQVSISPPSGKSISFRYFTVNGTAVIGDYNGINTVTTLPPGVSNAAITITIQGGTKNEPDETFEVRLTNAVNCILGRAVATGTILNDDLVPGRFDHFVFDPIVSPQVIGRTVPFTVRAVDAFEEIVTNFTGRIAFGALAGGVYFDANVVPDTVSNFVQGAASATALFTAPHSQVVLYVGDSYGTSNPFDVLAAIPLTVTLPAEATEGDGVLTNAGRVTIAAPQTQPVTVALTNASGIATPSSVLIPAGETNATFQVTVLDDSNYNGTHTASVTARATYFATHTGSMQIHDNEHGTVAFSLPPAVREGDAPVQLQLTVWPSNHQGLLFYFNNSDWNELSAPGSVYVPAGSTSFVTSVSAIDDNRLDGTKTVTLTSVISNWTVTPATIAVLDNESTNLTLTFGWQGPYREGVNITNLRNARLSGTLPTNLTVNLASSDESELIVPTNVTILAGQLSASFNATLPDDADFDGVQNVLITASAPGFGPATNTIPVSDNDAHHLSFNTYPKSAFVSAFFTVQVNARDINDVTISSPRLPLVLTAVGDHGLVPLGFIIDPPFGLETGARMSVRALAVDTNVRITVTTTNGLSLTGPPFDVTPPALQFPGVAAVDVACDPVAQRLYAVVPTNASAHAGRLVRVAPDTGAVEASIAVGFDPTRVVTDDQGHFAYVTGTNGLIRRFRLDIQLADLDFQLEPGLSVEDFAVMPGHPERLAVARRNTCCTPRHADVMLYENGVARPVSPALVFGPNRIEFGATSNRLFGISTESNSFTFFRLNATNSGLTVESATNGFGGTNVDFRFGGGRVYSTLGQVRDAETGASSGPLPWSGPVAVDSSLGRVFSLHLVSGTSWQLEALAETTLTNVGFASVSGVSGVNNLVRCGADTVAFISAQGLGLIHTALIFDTDTDGLRDDWERQYFGGLEMANGSPGSDPDGDGRTNSEEFQSGTNPTNAASVLRITGAGAGPSVTFGTVVGKRYRLLRSGTLGGVWQTVEDNIVGTGGPITVTNGASGTNSFYRIQLLP